MIRFLAILALCVITLTSQGQKYSLEKGSASFFSHAAIEDISADNKSVIGIFNPVTSEIAFSIPIHEFKFKKSLMEEHFNEKYMESDKFPKSTFQGKIVGFNPEGKGVQQVKATGKLTIHGVTNDIDVPGTLEIQNNRFIMKSKFIVKLQDYKIEIPKLLWQNIADQVEVTLDFLFKPQ